MKRYDSKNGLARLAGITVPALEHRLANLGATPDALVIYPGGKEPGWLFDKERVPELLQKIKPEITP